MSPWSRTSETNRQLIPSSALRRRADTRRELRWYRDLIALFGAIFFMKGAIGMPQEDYIVYLRKMVGDKKVILNATAVIITNDKNEVLLEKRSDNKKWGLPGGLLELEESIRTCAVREVKEELGVDIRLTGFIGVFNNPMMRWRENDEARVIAHTFTGEITGGEPTVNDHESLDIGYFSKDDLPEIHSPDNKAAIEAFYENKRNLIEGVTFDERS